MRVHQGSCPEGSMGRVFFNGRRRWPAAQGRRTARACSLGAGERRSVNPPEISAPALQPPRNAVCPGEARRGPRGDGGSGGNKGTCCHKGACSDNEKACGGGQERDDAGKLPPRIHSPRWPFLTCSPDPSSQAEVTVETPDDNDSYSVCRWMIRDTVRATDLGLTSMIRMRVTYSILSRDGARDPYPNPDPSPNMQTETMGRSHRQKPTTRSSATSSTRQMRMRMRMRT